MAKFSVDVVHKQCHNVTIDASSEIEAMRVAEMEAPEMIERGMARLKHIEYEIYSVNEEDRRCR